MDNMEINRYAYVPKELYKNQPQVLDQSGRPKRYVDLEYVLKVEMLPSFC